MKSSSAPPGVCENIEQLIGACTTARVVVSDPIDPDCVGTGLALQWYLQERGLGVDVISFHHIPPTMTGFPDIGTVQVLDPATCDFAASDMLCFVDGSSWSQFFGTGWQAVLGRLDLARVASIDHHTPDDIQRAIPERCLVRLSSSTAQVLYEDVIRPAGRTPDARVAEYLYRALLYDTRFFKNEMHAGAYAFAEALLACGVDHNRVVDTNYNEHEFELLAWAIEHTRLLPELSLSLLCIDAGARQELQQRFGEHYDEYFRLYKEMFERQIFGYHYGIVLTQTDGHTVRLNWRTRNYGDHLSIAEIARRAGFRAGGHRNAGGGTCDGDLAAASARLLAELERALQPCVE